MLNLIARVTILTAMSVVFCGMTAVLGAAPLFVLRNTEGRAAFLSGVAIAIGAMLAFKAFPLLIPFVAMTLLVFAFSEAVELGGGLLKSSVMALTLCCGVGLIFLGLWSKIEQVVIGDFIHEKMMDLLEQVPQLKATLLPELESLIVQTPSAAVILLSVALWFGILFGKRFSVQKVDSEFQILKLREFTFPDTMVWGLIATLPGTFLPQDLSLWHVVSVNVFNFLMFLYFLKGLALVANYFRVYRVGIAWQAITYVLLVSQLFILVAAFGLADIWMDFKGKLVKKAAEPIER